MLGFYATAHSLVDGVCAAALFSIVAANGGTEFAWMLVLYNMLAFATQPLVGLITDRLEHHHRVAAVGCALVLVGFLLPVSNWARISLLGIGNSIFHVGGGTVCLRHFAGRAAPLGVFVAPGALGLAVGSNLPHSGWLLCLALLVVAAGLFLPDRKLPESTRLKRLRISSNWKVLAGALLLGVIFVRALGGSAVSFPWKQGALLSILLAAFVMLGKAAGGFLSDRFGVLPVVLVSILFSGVLTIFFSDSMALSLLGQFALNCSMPVTLLLLYQLMPDAPGLSFGLAAAILYPGTLVGQAVRNSTFALPVAFVLTLAAMAAAVLIMQKRSERL